MNANSLSLSQDAFNAHMLGGVMDATCQNGETAAEAQGRRAAIVEMFRTFEPANAMQSMIACHCITLQFVLHAAMRDAGNVNMEPGMLLRMRACAMAISKTLHLWIAKYESMHTRDAAQAEACLPASQPEAAAATPAKPEAMRGPPARPDQPRPMLSQAPKAVLPMADPAPRGVKEALLSSAALPRGAPANGRLSVPVPTPVT
jgi:hypothetical protein